jgi:hypothetical protein
MQDLSSPQAARPAPVAAAVLAAWIREVSSR